MKILLTGAHGFIGRSLCAALSAVGHEVIAITRTEVDFSRAHDPADWRTLLTGVDVVINAVGIIRENAAQSFENIHAKAPQALFQACTQTDVWRVIQISALGADAEAQSHYHLSKRAADKFLLSLPLDAVVLRPSLVFGPDSPSSALFLRLASLPLIPLPGHGESRIAPIHIDDLIKAIVRLVEMPDLPTVRVLELVGPQSLSVRDYLSTLRKALQIKPARFVSIPWSLIESAAGLSEKLPTTSAINRETIAMLKRGNIALPFQTEQILGHKPRPVGEFIAPSYRSALRYQAYLQWLLPLFRLTLAVVWLFTGIISLGLYPVDDSYLLLAQVGISGTLAPFFLYGAAALDLAIGLVLLSSLKGAWLWWLQGIVVLGYSAIISVFLPQFWLHPFGPLLKNLPILALIIACAVLED